MVNARGLLREFHEAQTWVVGVVKRFHLGLSILMFALVLFSTAKGMVDLGAHDDANSSSTIS